MKKCDLCKKELALCETERKVWYIIITRIFNQKRGIKKDKERERERERERDRERERVGQSYKQTKTETERSSEKRGAF
jgi:hypothetical protein